jgi:L-alanine-DL-glutamate epimerase-like enolase superfamily enzyme
VSSIVVASLEARALSVPLVDPFVIASGQVDATRSVLVTVRLASGEIGLGEAAALPPVTQEDQPDVLAAIPAVARALVGTEYARIEDVVIDAGPVARAGIETALLDAIAKRERLPLRALLGGEVGARTNTLITDVTIPILAVERMVVLAREWRARGFTCFKVKVGKELEDDVRAIDAIAKSVRDATFRIDANGGFTAKAAIALVRAMERSKIRVECFEQPCATEDIDGMAEVSASISIPVVADESVKSVDDVERLTRRRACRGVNLKLAKSGGLRAAYAIGRAARAAGMTIMVGGMVETRLGMTAAAHVAAALGGVEYVDLDTAWLLAEDPFEGGYEADGPRYTLSTGYGLDVHLP